MVEISAPSTGLLVQEIEESHIGITQHFGPDAEHISRDLLLKRASRVSVPGIKFRSHI